MHNMIRNMCINKAHVIFAAAGLAHLSAGDVNGRYDVCRMSVEAPDASGHRWTHQILTDVQLHQSRGAALQHLHTQSTDAKRWILERIQDTFVHSWRFLSLVNWDLKPVGPLWRLVLVRLLHTRWTFLCRGSSW